MNAIEAHGIFKVFGKRPQAGVERLRGGATREELRSAGLTAAVIDANFEVREGEIFVVMGLSGSGKSTLIRLVNGLLTPTAGELLVYGDDVVKMDEQQLRKTRREKVSMVFQHFALLPHRTVGENAAYALKIQGINRDERERRAKEALALVGLKGWEGSLPGQLSGGMRQRVGLARALAAGTDIMLMDEAFSALDPLIKREMQDQLVELQNKLGKTILFITHDLNEAMRLGDRIAVMRDGRIVQIGNGEQILNQPANEYVERFVQDVDRTRVLTARTVMTPATGVVGVEQELRSASELMRQHATTRLFVIDRERKLCGAIDQQRIATAGADGTRTVGEVVDGQVVSIAADTRLSELLPVSAACEEELAVVDGDGHIVGSLSRTTLLKALGQIRAGKPVSADAPNGDRGQEPAHAGAEVNAL